MRFASQDWHSSPLRGELAVERDHLSRMVYLELLLKLNEAGGRIRREEVPGSVLVSPREAERAIVRLLKSGRLVDRDGWISNPRVIRDLKHEQEYREQQARFGRKRHGGDGGASGSPEGGLGGASAPSTSSVPSSVSGSVPSASTSADPENGDGALAPNISARRAAFVQQLLAEWGRLGGKGRTPTNTEYALACRWFEAGVELRWALTAIGETWRREAAKGNQIRSLTYFDGAVQEESRRVAAGRTR